MSGGDLQGAIGTLAGIAIVGYFIYKIFTAPKTEVEKQGESLWAQVDRAFEQSPDLKTLPQSEQYMLKQRMLYDLRQKQKEERAQKERLRRAQLAEKLRGEENSLLREFGSSLAKENPLPLDPGGVYVLDTNVLLDEPHVLLSIKVEKLIIPLTVLEELDKHKSNENEAVAKTARQITRYLDSLLTNGSSLSTGISLSSGTIIQTMSCPQQIIGKYLSGDMERGKADNKILALACHIRDSETAPTYLVTNDVNLRVKANALGLQVTVGNLAVLPAESAMGKSKALEASEGLDFKRKHSFNIDGTPMTAGGFDINGNPYGLTSLDDD